MSVMARRHHDMRNASIYALSALLMFLGAGCMTLFLIITA